MSGPHVKIVVEGEDERMAELAAWLERVLRGNGCGTEEGEAEAVIKIIATPDGMLAEGVRGECLKTWYTPWDSWRLATAANSVLHGVLVPLGLATASPHISEQAKEDELIAKQLEKLGYL